MFFLFLFVISIAVSYGSPYNPEVSSIEETDIEIHPYQVAILNSTNKLKCSGAIISDYYVLTAGQCVSSILSDEELKDWAVRAGSSQPGQGGSLHEIDEIILHEKYEKLKSNVYRNDVALIRVKNPFEFDETRQPAVLNKFAQQVKDGIVALVSGWASIRDQKDRLHSSNVPIIGKEECDEIFSDIGGVGVDKVCAGYLNGDSKDSCGNSGDVGAPLTYDGQILGVLSSGMNCKKFVYPNVYTDVAYFNSWIVEHTELV